MGQVFHDVGTPPQARWKKGVEEPMRKVSEIFYWLRPMCRPRKYRFADLADERGTPWPEIKLMMPKAIEAVESAFDNNKEKLMNTDINRKKATILTAVPVLIAEKTSAEELKKLRDLVLQQREQRIEQQKRSK